MAQTGRQTALHVQSVVRQVQLALHQTDPTLPTDGKFSRQTYAAFLVAVPAAFSVVAIPELATDGPLLYATAITSLSPQDAAWFATAWGWWMLKRHPPVTTAAMKEVSTANGNLLAAGDMPISVNDAELFVGDAPPASAVVAALPYIAGGVVLVGGLWLLVRRARRTAMHGWGRVERLR